MSFKKDKEISGPTFYQDKSLVLQEARVFNESPISPRKCRILLTKVIYLLYMGETLTRQEATILFFGATKLFQHKDPALRQMVYLAIKELCFFSDDVIMVTASIMKDMQPNVQVIYRPNAIRALSRVVDPCMVQDLERFFKSAIVDKNTCISSAALVSAYQLHIVSHDVVRRWGNEAHEAIISKSSSAASAFGGAGSYLGFSSYSSSANQQSSYEAVASSSYITQYHALGLLYLIRQGDRMAVTKLVQQLAGGLGGGGGGVSSGQASVLRSPYALCMLVRYAAQVADKDANLRPPMMQLLEAWLQHKSDMVNYETARSICEMKNVTTQELYKPISVLQLFLSSPKSTLKFAAIRTLAQLAQTHPMTVQTCNVDMENLITDTNRSIATYAITTLLKTGNEASVDRLMKQISGFMSKISDEFKVIVVDAIRSLCLKFPSKQNVMLSFLSRVLRDEGGYDFKRAVVEAIFDMVQFIRDCKETALTCLCEFIEDCEFTKLSVKILHLLGVEGPKMSQPHKYIRYISNRAILENAIVRAAAVSSLAKFGMAGNSLNGRIKVLLERCLDDVDDEVRDRAVMYLRMLGESKLVEKVVNDESSLKLSALETALQTYVLDPSLSKGGFDMTQIPRITRDEERQEVLREKSQATSSVVMTSDSSKSVYTTTSNQASASVSIAGGAAAVDDSSLLYTKQLADIPQFADYGPVLKSSPKPTELTEAETEYVVSAVKHIFADHIVIQYNITNTLPDTVLENVAVVVNGAAEAGLKEDFIITISSLSLQNPNGIVYVSFTREGGHQDFAQATLQNTLGFISKEVDPTSGEAEEQGYHDEYQTDDLDLVVADYINPTSYSNFVEEWDKLKNTSCLTETFQLTALNSLQSACDTLIQLIGMQPLSGSEMSSSISVHTLNMSGSVMAANQPIKALVRCRMTFQTAQGVTMEMSVRAENQIACQLIMSAIS